MKIFNLVKSVIFSQSYQEVIASSFDENLLIETRDALQIKSDEITHNNYRLETYYKEWDMKKYCGSLSHRINLHSNDNYIINAVKELNIIIESKNEIILEAQDMDWNMEFLRWCHENIINPELFNDNHGENIPRYVFYIVSSEFME